MSRETFHHGVRVLTSPGGPRPIQTVETATIGVVGTAPDADTSVFPLDTPVLIWGQRQKAALLDTTGNGQGTLHDAVDAIMDQVGTAIVVVRVEEGQTEQETLSNVIGGIDADGSFKGAHVLRRSENALQIKPKMLIAPGWTHQRPSGVASVSVTSAGLGYDPETTEVNFSGGNGSGAAGSVTIEDGTGKILSVSIPNPGYGYLSAPTISIVDTAGGGSGATVTASIDTVRNPVVTELAQIAEKLRAHVFADTPNTTAEEAVLYRQDFGTRRVIPSFPYVRKWDDTIDSWSTRPLSAIAAGLQAKSDNERGFWWSVSNQLINGIVGIDKDIDYSLTDPNTIANYLNKNGVLTAIHDQGFKLWGNYTCSDDPRFIFSAVSRTDDVIAESIARAQKVFVDRPITRSLFDDIAEGVNQYLRRLKQQGAIINGRCWFDPENNTPDLIQLGKVQFDYDFGPAYPAQDILFMSQINNDYLLEIF